MLEIWIKRFLLWTKRPVASSNLALQCGDIMSCREQEQNERVTRRLGSLSLTPSCTRIVCHSSLSQTSKGNFIITCKKARAQGICDSSCLQNNPGLSTLGFGPLKREAELIIPGLLVLQMNVTLKISCLTLRKTWKPFIQCSVHLPQVRKASKIPQRQYPPLILSPWKTMQLYFKSRICANFAAHQ